MVVRGASFFSRRFSRSGGGAVFCFISPERFEKFEVITVVMLIAIQKCISLKQNGCYCNWKGTLSSYSFILALVDN